jgi:hypothetical protein
MAKRLMIIINFLTFAEIFIQRGCLKIQHEVMGNCLPYPVTQTRFTNHARNM